jgi:hypothetical protein
MQTTRRMLLGVASTLLAYTTDHTLATPTSAEIPEAELRRATRETLPAFDDGDGDIMTTDREYYAPVNADALAAVGELVALLPYRTDRFDCDNLAGAYRTLSAFLCGVNAVGTVIDWSGSHAYNIVVDADGDATLYEPQTDTAVAIGETDSYVGERVTVIF